MPERYIPELTKELKQRPNWAEGHEQLARMYILGEDDVVNMFKHFYIAAQLDNSLNQPHKYLKEVYYGMGRYEDSSREDKADKSTDYYGGTILVQGLCAHIRELALQKKSELEGLIKELSHETRKGKKRKKRFGIF